VAGVGSPALLGLPRRAAPRRASRTSAEASAGDRPFDAQGAVALQEGVLAVSGFLKLQAEAIRAPDDELGGSGMERAGCWDTARPAPEPCSRSEEFITAPLLGSKHY